MQSSEIRTRFLKFFENRGHKIIPSASLVPENDPSVLFNTAGMQPLVPYLLGQEHPMGKRIADVQKCVRTGDLDDIGDNRHFSFFEMMGNWSLGDYFKEEAIKWSYEFLTSKEEGLGLDVSRLYVTIFEGDENAPYDQESKDIWMSLGIPENRIYALPGEDNWWSPGDNGPCGPCSEMFYDMSGNIGDLAKEGFIEACKKEDVIEIWNDVFMEYEKKDGKVIGKLKQKNVDTGAGLERITAVMQGKKTAYDTDLFSSLIQIVRNNTDQYDETSARIMVDHIKSATFIVGDGILPGKDKASYVLRKLIRRAVRRSLFNEFTSDHIFELLIDEVVRLYGDCYPNLISQNISIKEVIVRETRDVIKLDSQAAGVIQKAIDLYLTKNNITPLQLHEVVPGQDMQIDNPTVPANVMFDLITTHGIDKDMLINYLKNKHYFVFPHHLEELNILLEKHKKLSQTASAGMFKGGLANHNEKTIRLHTAHHLLLAALQEVVSPDIKQRGSNITEERLRIDFVCDHKLTDEEKKKVEDLVNQKIQAKLNVVRREMPLIEAEKIGAQMEFGAKYPEVVSVYFIEDQQGSIFSKEFCGGPHVSNTSELGIFKIQKEEAVSAGVRRIKAVLE